ncbi:MAG: hydroxyisourate hydrolase [Ignavibacteriae bacterium]|nr:hydroxyisourate hydrolase [Ignavibacteria bacterium]MBI3363454.1 hydroxyisourate hydrolase [Ignavibacteriota bacterium]
MKNPITTHVLDTTRGKPAVGVKVILEVNTPAKEWKELARGETNTDGRITDLLHENTKLAMGTYRLTFLTDGYFRSVGQEGFFPYVYVVFELKEPITDYHVPLLLSPFGYSTYKGS